ncbi:nicotinate phosphoribosyltransferase, partial [Neofusicoccum ribis]
MASNVTDAAVISLLDTDFYKFTMQFCVLKYFPNTEVTYQLTNRTQHMRFTQEAYHWLRTQIDHLGSLVFTEDELSYLESFPFFDKSYIRYLSTFRLHPDRQVVLSFKPDLDDESQFGELSIHVEGLWKETILYEIPLLALTSEAYFKFCENRWTHEGQQEKACEKGMKLLGHGCHFSELGTRRRRDYKTQGLVIQGLLNAAKKMEGIECVGRFLGTSNVHFARKFGIPALGTIAHEWFMGVAAVTDNYERANEIALSFWVNAFGKGVLSVALTDTFGTMNFLDSFRKPITLCDSFSSATNTTKESLGVPLETYAEIFAGVRQDSGDPREFVNVMRAFYDHEGIVDMKTIVFTDSLNTDLCIEYKEAAEAQGFRATFGIGTFLTNDFLQEGTGIKSAPLNVVMKLSTAERRPAVKLSDNAGKNSGDKEKLAEVKRRI